MHSIHSSSSTLLFELLHPFEEEFTLKAKRQKKANTIILRTEV
jgi:hypothetical protein